MWEISISKEEIKEMMMELDERKAIGPDEVSGYILKECRQEIAELIHDIIECSIKTGKIPQDWKRADIMLIYKNGNKEEAFNYRPVSLTSIVCQICEKVIKKQWSEYLEREGITYRQFGFRTGRSCVTNLWSFYSKVIDIIQERDRSVDCIFLDLKKAFDKVPHMRLLWKLEHIGGLKGTIKNWMEGREMRTVVKDEKSEWKEVKSGVLQGSVLALIMFSIYLNDMIEGVSSYINVCRWCKVTNKDRKPQGLWGATEIYKQDIWMEQDMGNGI